jgi:predicted nucleic acid-binding protein
VFVDSNIPMYVAGRDHPLREPSRRLLGRIQAGELEGCTSTEVLQEILDRYVGLRRPELAVEVYDLFVGLCSIVFPVTLADTDRVRDLVRANTPASVRDLVHAAVMLNNDVRNIASHDSGFDQVKGIERLQLP